MFEDQYVELLPARTTMQTVDVGGFGGAGGQGGAGGPALALSLAANVAVVTQTSTAVSLFGDATAINEVVTGNATSGAAEATGGTGGDGGGGGAGIG
ncbi:hypothetical protein JOD57_000917 [Geodermatophilus bullaregiensis]|uniref:hypothetical protein n=1 Tax=Geodermatophilus bullaregiensis TaxID=1564160 RepID=UPI001958153C|nr:hypothetical protein [Geodermatophilus bullaregiensis]MBM7805080.1 hypothetical protein [Geodermatophilus bullaregiensis]